MGIRKRFQSSATLRIGRLPSGGYKLYVIGKVRNHDPRALFWIEAGSTARRNPPLPDFEAQRNTGYSTKAEVKAFARKLFPNRERFLRFIEYDLGSDSIETMVAVLEDEALIPWDEPGEAS